MNNSLLVNNKTTELQDSERKALVNNATTSALTAKAMAEVQGKVYMAKQFPRDYGTVMAKLQASCERPSLAKVAEYEYAKGGTTINGASIKLLETVAQCYGNIHYAWKEISRDKIKKTSMCIADAWDLENNVSSSLEFEVSHYRDTKQGAVLVTSERDLYELIASNAARRVRKCLENVVPRDIVDQAREWCDETLTKKIDIQEGIDKAGEYFKEKYNITLNQIETYFGMKRQGFTKNTYLKLQRLYTAFKDGVSDPQEVFITTTPTNPNAKGVANTIIPEDKTDPKEDPEIKQPKKKVEKNTNYDFKDGVEPNLFQGDF